MVYGCNGLGEASCSYATTTSWTFLLNPYIFSIDDLIVGWWASLPDNDLYVRPLDDIGGIMAAVCGEHTPETPSRYRCSPNISIHAIMFSPEKL